MANTAAACAHCLFLQAFLPATLFLFLVTAAAAAAAAVGTAATITAAATATAAPVAHQAALAAGPGAAHGVGVLVLAHVAFELGVQGGGARVHVGDRRVHGGKERRARTPEGGPQGVGHRAARAAHRQARQAGKWCVH